MSAHKIRKIYQSNATIFINDKNVFLNLKAKISYINKSSTLS